MCFQLIVKVHLHKIPKEPFFQSRKKKEYLLVCGRMHPARILLFSVEIDHLKKSF